MAKIDNFNANDVAPNEFTPIPAGQYLCVISASEWKDNKAKTGQYLELVFKVAAGQYRDRTVKARLNMKNQSEEAVRIARGDLSSICRAVGIMQPKDSAQLHNIPILVTVAVTNPDSENRVYNEIKGYAKRVTEVAAAAPEPASVASADGGAKPAWMG
jgi:hypothetical protein